MHLPSQWISFVGLREVLPLQMFLLLSGFRGVLFTLGWQSHTLALLAMVNHDPWNDIVLDLYLYCGQLISHFPYIPRSKLSEINHTHYFGYRITCLLFSHVSGWPVFGFSCSLLLAFSEVWRRNALSLMLLKFRMCKHVSHLRLLMSGIYLTSIHKLDLFCWKKNWWIHFVVLFHIMLN